MKNVKPNMSSDVKLLMNKIVQVHLMQMFKLILGPILILMDPLKHQPAKLFKGTYFFKTEWHRRRGLRSKDLKNPLILVFIFMVVYV